MMFQWFKKFGLFGLFTLILFGISISLLLSSSLQLTLESLTEGPDRTILSIATGRIFPKDGLGKVLKIQTRDEGLILEIYKQSDEGLSTFVDKIVIGPHNDAQFQFQARATNLALKDMNGDEQFEIIAPSFDPSFVSHLNIYVFNSATNRFEIFTE